jgi:osmotically-inducible protein OsmY
LAAYWRFSLMGAININAEEGVIVLRGELDRAEHISQLEEAARRVKGVRGVRNLLYLHGTPAPNKPSP